MTKLQEATKEYNETFLKKIIRIEDNFFRDKLLSGLIKFEPDVWEDCQLKPMEERKLG